MVSEASSGLDTPELVKCVTEGLRGDQPIFLYFDDLEAAVKCLARLRTLGCA